MPQLKANNSFTGTQSITGSLGINTTVPTQTLEVDLGNAIVRGAGNFHAKGNTAIVYVGDTDHLIEAIDNSGLMLGAWKAPQALFIQDQTGNVGIGTTSPANQLDVYAQSTTVNAINAVGFNNGLGNGGVAITAAGGTGEFGNGRGGTAVQATGGAGLLGGNGIDASGGAGNGSQPGDGVGGTFTGGNASEGGDGVDAYAGSGSAGTFTGDVSISGTLSAGTKDFKIDHPLDPANKYLVHASVESSEMMNIYTSNVTTDAQGAATVQLPGWFEVLNTDFRYQLTVIGQFAQAIIAHKIQGNQFTIRTNAPNVEVSWQVTGLRHDAYAKAHPLVIEEEKDARLRGFYIHPELYGAPPQKQIEWARHPQMMRRIKEARTRQLAGLQGLATTMATRAAAQPQTASPTVTQK